MRGGVSGLPFSLTAAPPRAQVGAIIITPTRELAIQIDEVLSHFTKHLPQFRYLLWGPGSVPHACAAPPWGQGCPASLCSENVLCCSQILWIGGRNPGEDVDRFKQQG